MPGHRRRVIQLAALAIFAFPAAALLISPLGFTMPDGGSDWTKLYGKAERISSMNLGGAKAAIDFFYHGPEGKEKPYLEGRVVKEGKDKVTVGISVWKQDVAFHAYDKPASTLEIYLLPRHLKDPKEVRIQVLQMTEFEAPAGVRTVRVIYLP